MRKPMPLPSLLGSDDNERLAVDQAAGCSRNFIDFDDS
jgi:hypothetical protein